MGCVQKPSSLPETLQGRAQLPAVGDTPEPQATGRPSCSVSPKAETTSGPRLPGETSRPAWDFCELGLGNHGYNLTTSAGLQATTHAATPSPGHCLGLLPGPVLHTGLLISVHFRVRWTLGDNQVSSPTQLSNTWHLAPRKACCCPLPCCLPPTPEPLLQLPSSPELLPSHLQASSLPLNLLGSLLSLQLQPDPTLNSPGPPPQPSCPFLFSHGTSSPSAHCRVSYLVIQGLTALLEGELHKAPLFCS